MADPSHTVTATCSSLAYSGTVGAVTYPHWNPPPQGGRRQPPAVPPPHVGGPSLSRGRGRSLASLTAFICAGITVAVLVVQIAMDDITLGSGLLALAGIPLILAASAQRKGNPGAPRTAGMAGAAYLVLYFALLSVDLYKVGTVLSPEEGGLIIMLVGCAGAATIVVTEFLLRKAGMAPGVPPAGPGQPPFGAAMPPYGPAGLPPQAMPPRSQAHGPGAFPQQPAPPHGHGYGPAAFPQQPPPPQPYPQRPQPGPGYRPPQ